MDIDIDPDSSTAPFDQLRLQIIEQVRSGQLIAGTKIPTVRALAVEVGLAPNTVAKAYRELGEQGVIETRGKQAHSSRAAVTPFAPEPRRPQQGMCRNCGSWGCPTRRYSASCSPLSAAPNEDGATSRSVTTER